jgi:hypothetical protein
MDGTCSTNNIGNIHNILVGEPQGKRPYGRFGRRWDDNIKTILKDTGGENFEWFLMAQEGFL